LGFSLLLLSSSSSISINERSESSSMSMTAPVASSKSESEPASAPRFRDRVGDRLEERFAGTVVMKVWSSLSPFPGSGGEKAGDILEPVVWVIVFDFFEGDCRYARCLRVEGAVRSLSSFLMTDASAASSALADGLDTRPDVLRRVNCGAEEIVLGVMLASAFESSSSSESSDPAVVDVEGSDRRGGLARFAKLPASFSPPCSSSEVITRFARPRLVPLVEWLSPS
jgi:hypothetical protein